MATVFYENSFVSAYQIITFHNEQDSDSDDASYQMFFNENSRTFEDQNEQKRISRTFKALKKDC